MMVEGARKFIQLPSRWCSPSFATFMELIEVSQGAPVYDDAHRVAATISTSMLVKTALHGEDAK